MRTRSTPLLALVLTLSTAASAADVNSATQIELDAIRGIGPALSGTILQERAKAPFKDWDDFLGRVRILAGTSPAKLSSQGLTVNGKPFDATAAKAAVAAPSSGR